MRSVRLFERKELERSGRKTGKCGGAIGFAAEKACGNTLPAKLARVAAMLEASRDENTQAALSDGRTDGFAFMYGMQKIPRHQMMSGNLVREMRLEL